MPELRELEKLAEGREAEIFALEDGNVLRLMRSRDAGPAVQRQAQALLAAHKAGIDVPAPHGEMTVVGRPGLIMERLDGPDLLTLVGRRPWHVYRVGAVLGDLQAQMHEVVAPLEIEDLIEAHRRRLESSDRVPEDVKRAALRALDDLPAGDRLCHGDFHPGNLIEAAGKAAIIDWSNVLRGDPTADYVRTDLILRLGDPPPGAPFLIRKLSALGRDLMRVAFRRAYRRRRAIDDDVAARWLLPVAAARLTEHIEVERPKLLKLLEEAIAALPPDDDS